MQQGVTGLHLTLGEGETKAFYLQQDMLRTSGKPYFEMLPGDLSNTMRMQVCLWFMKGAGAECITNIEVKNKPDGMSMAQLKSRAKSMNANNNRCIWHVHLPFEIRGKQSIKAGKGGFAITDIQLAFTDDEGDEFELKGYTKSGDLQKWGFHAFLWTYSRTPVAAEDMYKLGNVEKQTWFDKRLLQVIYSFNLSNADIRHLRAIYEEIQGDSTMEVLRVKDVFEGCFNHEVTPIVKWVVNAINPKRDVELSFSEYVR